MTQRRQRATCQYGGTHITRIRMTHVEDVHCLAAAPNGGYLKSNLGKPW